MKLRTGSLFALGVLFAAGAVQAYRKIDECRAIVQRDSHPTSITAAELAARGPGEARYLSITDYEIERRDVVVTKWEKAEGFFSASLFLRPKGRPRAPGQPRVVVTFSATTDAEIERYFRKTGPIVGSIRNEYKDGVAQPHEWKVKGLKPELCWFVADGEKPIVPANSEAVIVGFSILALACFAGGARSMGGDRPRSNASDLSWHAPVGTCPAAGGLDLRSAAFLPDRNANRPTRPD
jgi:hypothetical protein